MRLGVDAHVLQGKFQGSRTYLWNLYKAVLRRSPTFETCFLGDWKGTAPFGPSASHVDFPDSSRMHRMLIGAARVSRDQGIDVFHCQYMTPIGIRSRVVLTVHDILFESHPQFFGIAERLRNRFLVRRSALRAHQVHTVSEHSRQALAHTYGIDPALIHVVPNGVDSSEFHPNGRKDSVDFVHQRRGVAHYILSVGRLEPRKNHLQLLKAYTAVCSEHSDPVPLVIAGQPDFGFSAVLEAIDRHPFRERIHILTDVGDEELPHLYRAARLFVYPSFAEGFGIPPLEALACGVPTVCSRTTSMPEVVGDSALMVSPESTDELIGAMLELLNQPALAEKLRLGGLVQASTWTWDRSAERFMHAVSQI